MQQTEWNNAELSVLWSNGLLKKLLVFTKGFMNQWYMESVMMYMSGYISQWSAIIYMHLQMVVLTNACITGYYMG